MKITQEVREFARLNASPSGEEQLGGAERGDASPSPASEEAEAGMAEMSERYRRGGELYVPTMT
jgi:hypothetical protein